jgi:hypothetical protein
MMGKKERSFATLTDVPMEELVPQDHFYRHLEKTLDLSFVRELVQETYAGKGRTSIDPVVFFKLQSEYLITFTSKRIQVNPVFLMGFARVFFNSLEVLYELAT